MLDRVTGENLSYALKGAIMRHAWTPDTHLQTDGSMHYPRIADRFASHTSVDHEAGEYVRGDVTTNQVEGFFSQLKRSIDGTHHHVSRAHLHRYLGEFDFRYSNCKVSDQGKMEMIVNRTTGRRMTYRKPTEG